MSNKWLKLLFGKKESLLGVDVSSTAVKILEIGLQGDLYRVENYGIEPLPIDAVVEKDIKKPAAVSKALENILIRNQVKSHSAAIAVPGSAAFTRVIKIDSDLSDIEMESEVAVEAESLIPYPLDDVNLDHEILGPSINDPTKINVLVAASRRENVYSRVDTLSQAGLETKVVDIDTFAMERAFEIVAKALPDGGRNQIIAMVDIGASITTLNVFDNLRSVYMREQAFGGRQLTNEIQRRYGLSFEEAVLAKKFSDLPDDYIPEVLEPFKEAISQQVSRALQFFFSSEPYNKIHYIVLAGGTAAIGGLDEMIQRELSTKAFIANPFADMLVSPNVNATQLNEDAPSLMVCCGLALRNFDK